MRKYIVSLLVIVLGGSTVLSPYPNPTMMVRVRAGESQPVGPSSTIPTISVQVVKDKKDGPTLTLPSTVQGLPGAFIPIPATTTATSVQWYIVDPGLNLFPVNLLKDSRTAVVSSGKEGVYRVLAYAAAGDVATEPAVCTVTIGTPAPPIPPTPTDPLTLAIQQAYTADTDGDKASSIKGLAAVYRQAAASTVDDTSITTLASLFNVLSTAARQVVPADKVPKTRRAIADYLNAQIGTGDSTTKPLDVVTRMKVRAVFNQVADSLGSIK